MRKHILLLFFLISFFLYACKNHEATTIGEELNTSVPVSNNDVTDTGNTPGDTEISNTISDSSENASSSPEPDEGFFEYFLPGGTTLTSGLYFNEPSEFYYDKNGSSNARCIFENTNGERITIASASPWDAERFDNYIENGVWESPWEEDIDSMNEFETMYGTVTVLSGYSESSACIIDNCFFNYIDVLWYIVRFQGQSPRSINELISEILSSKEEPAAADNSTIPPQHIEILDGEYEYLLSDIGLTSNGDFCVNNIFGFNFSFDGYSSSGTGTSTVEGMEEITANSSFSFIGNDCSISVEFANDISYLKKFILYDSYQEDFEIGFCETLTSLQKEEKVDTKYGTAQIIYQTSYRDYEGFERSLECELILLDVNEHEIIIQCNYGSASQNGYQGVLIDMLPQMFDTN